MDKEYERKCIELAYLIFPDVNETVDDLEIRYKERNLKEGAAVTRYAPSPTGFLHTGSLFTTLVDMRRYWSKKGSKRKYWISYKGVKRVWTCSTRGCYNCR